jgi:uncharacterized repeat protein (TIGR03803 family)
VRLYFIGVDGNLYNTLANNLAGNYADPQAAYLYNVVANNSPIASVIEQIVVNSNGIPQDGPNTFVFPSSPQYQQILDSALLWGYNKYNNVNAGFTNVLLSDLTFWQNINAWDSTLGQFDIDSIEFFSDIQTFMSLVQDAASVELSPGQAQQVGSVAQLLFDALQGAPAYQATNSTQAASVINILISANVVANTNYTAPEMVMGMANLTPMQLATLESQLENAIGIDGQNIPTNEQQYIDLLFKSLCTSSIQNYGSLGSSAVSTGGYAFFQAYFASQSLGASSPLGFAWDAGTSAATRSIADGAIPTATVWSADVLFNIFLEPQLPLLQDDNKIVKDLATEIFPELISISTNMTDLQGIPYFPAGPAFTKDTGIAASLIADHYQIQYLLDPVNWGPPVSEQQQLFGVLTIWSNAISSAQALANNSSGIPPPAVNGLGETHGKLGDEFTISGANLCNAVAVYFNNSPAWFQVNSSTNITTVAPAGTNTVDIRVVGPGGVSQINANDKFTYGTLSTATNVLSVTSSNPGSGVSITVSPNDTGGIGNGSTPFARNYTNNTQVTLTAPSTAGGNNFQKWQQNGADYSNNRSAAITMNASYTMTAIYASPPSSTYTLTVASSNPNSGVSISASPNDNNGSGGGSTTFTLTYNSNKLVYLTAPSSAGGNNFLTWQLDGVTYNNALDSGLTMNGNHTMTAVFGGIGIIGLSGNLAFGNVQTNAQAVRQFTIQSQGGYQPLHVSSISYTSPGFSGSWSGTIPIGGSTNVSVTFSPTTNGNYNGWVIVNSDATVGSNSNAISGTGVVAPPPPPVTPFPVAAFSVIYSFPYQSALSGPFAYGANPGAGLVQGTDGDFYGTTVYGGGYGEGVIFRMNAAGSNQLLYSFPAKTSQPGAQLTFGNDGNLYGTMRFGGVNGLGSVFNGVFSTIYSFAESSSDQSGEPISPLIQGTDGYFYGTTRWGWNGGGSVFRVTTTGAFKLINSLDDSLPGIGWELIAPLVQGMDGNLYGTTFAGGTNGPGTVFKLTLSGALTPLYSFTGGLDGGHPQAGLVLDKSGYLYGTTSEGGTFYDGTVFKMATNGNLIWAVSLNGTNGSNAGYGIPAFLEAPLIQASDGNLYGVTPSGGTFGAGTVFQISTNGLLTVLHSFQGSDGANPFGLMQGRDGNLYGTTWEGGTDGGGTVFRLVIPPGTPSVNTTGGVFNIKWNAVPGQTYQVKYSTDLSKTNWMSLISAITPTNSTAAAIDSVGPDSQRFYRIVEYPEAW